MQVAQRYSVRAGKAAWLICLAAALGVFSCAAVQFLVAPLNQVLRVVPDDAFYYLQIARNLVHSGRSTADGLSNTNGYHPLWMLIAAGLAWLAPTTGSLLRAAMGTSLALHAICGVGVVIGLQPVIGWRWATTAGACWLVNPLAFLIAEQTVESPSYCLSLLLVLRLFLDHDRRIDGSNSSKRTLRLGAALGLLCLARTEGIVIAALVLSAIGVRPLALRSIAAVIRDVGTAVLAFVATLAPWLCFSWWQVGTIVQDSGAMKVLWAADARTGWHDTVRGVTNTARFVLGRGGELTAGFAVSAWMIGCVCAAIATSCAFVCITEPHGRHARAIRAVIAPTLAILLIYGLTMTEQQVWWLITPCLAFVLLASLTLSAVSERLHVSEHSQVLLAGTFILISVLAFLGSHRTARVLYPWQPDVLLSQQEFEQLVPQTERIGCFNAGIPMYFGRGHVVALDGLVSHRARELWAQHQVDRLLTEFDVRYIADEQRALNRALRFVSRPPELEQVASHYLTGWPTRQRLLWRVNPPH